MDASGYPSMVDVTTMWRRVIEIERQLALASAARSLTQSSIGDGGLRVYDDGSIHVEDTGSFIIETGNLVLGDGKIQGDALEDQVSTEVKSTSNSSFAISTDYQLAASITLNRPDWATRTVVSCQATVRIPVQGYIYGALTGTPSTPGIGCAPRNSFDDSDVTRSMSWGGVTNSATITASVYGRVLFTELTTPKQADLQVTALYFR